MNWVIPIVQASIRAGGQTLFALLFWAMAIWCLLFQAYIYMEVPQVAPNWWLPEVTTPPPPKRDSFPAAAVISAQQVNVQAKERRFPLRL